MKRVVCFHLYNDYSGSPIVLRNVLEGLLKKHYRISLVTSAKGILDELKSYDNLTTYNYRYHFSNNLFITMLRYCLIQIYTFFMSFRWLFYRDVVFYINTILPIGPALAGKLMRKRVIYHYHENAFAKGVFYKVLAFFMEKTASEIVCVSAFQASFLASKEKITIIPNALTQKFINKLSPKPEASFDRKRVLMISSLKLYKGPIEFIRLSQLLPQFSFELVANDTDENINKFIIKHNLSIPPNLTIFPRQKDVSPSYNRASIVLNLTNKEKVVETFGLTTLEAFSAGLPVIVPTIGGISEIVIDEFNGFKIDVQRLSDIADCINKILTNKQLYIKLSNNALEESRKFNEELMLSRLTLLLG